MTLDKMLETAYTVLFPVLGWFLFLLFVRFAERLYGLSGDLLKKSINDYEDVEKYLKKLLGYSGSGLSNHRKFMLLGKTSRACKHAERRIRLYLFDNAGNKILADSACMLPEISLGVSSAQKALLAKQDDQMRESLTSLSSSVASMKDAVRRAM